MKPATLLLVLALVLAGGIAVWFGRSGSGANETTVPAAPPAQPAAQPPKAQAPLETPPAERTSEATQPAAPATPARSSLAEQPKPEPPPLNPSVIAGGLDGGTPSDAGASGGTEAFEAKYKGASKADLEAAYKALDVLYQDNAQGRVSDKARAITGDALDELAREVAWLKQQAFGGG